MNLTRGAGWNEEMYLGWDGEEWLIKQWARKLSHKNNEYQTINYNNSFLLSKVTV